MNRVKINHPNPEREVLIIGNKPYNNFRFNNIIDKFDTNFRCGIVLPNNNNGTKYDKLGLCSHVYQNLITAKLERNAFIKLYEKNFEKEYLANYYDRFPESLSKFKEIFHARFRTNVFNKSLNEWGCPYRFSKIPRTGQTIIFENLLQQNKVFIAFFSLKYDAVRISRGTRSSIHGVDGCHSSSDEIKIIMWLHEKGLIDATLCMLEDEEEPTLNCKDLQPSEFILNILRKEYGDVKIKK